VAPNLMNFALTEDGNLDIDLHRHKGRGSCESRGDDESNVDISHSVNNCWYQQKLE
jgi:hypothetical protein